MNSPDAESPEVRDKSPSTARLDQPDTARLVYAVVWVVFVLIAGSAVASYSALRFGYLGLLAIMAIGWAGGVVAKKILGVRSKLVGGLLVAACFLISGFTMVAWIRGEFVNAEDSWVKAASLLPTFVGEYPIFTIVTVIVFFCGASSAWHAVVARYVRVRVD